MNSDKITEQQNPASSRIDEQSVLKILEIIGLALIGGTIYSFIGMIESELRWPVFWSCAGGALAIIVYRNYMRRRREKNT